MDACMKQKPMPGYAVVAGRVWPYHEGPDNHIWHLGQLVMQKGSSGMICDLWETWERRKPSINDVIQSTTWYKCDKIKRFDMI